MFSEELKQQFQSVYQLFSEHYRHFWVTKGEVKAHIKYWLSEIDSNNIDIEILLPVAEKIIRSPKFKKYPPNSSEFIEECLDYAKGSDPLYEIVLTFVRRLPLVYVSMKTTDTNEMARVWYEQIRLERIDPVILKGACDAVMKRSAFQQYPPTLNALVFESHRINFDDRLPCAEEAFRLQHYRKFKTHPVFIEVIMRLGSFSFSQESEFAARRSFESMYTDVIREFSLNGHRKTESVTRVEQERESVNRVVNDLLSKWN